MSEANWRKQCKECGAVLPDGKLKYCSARCRNRAHCRRYRKTHREKINAYQRGYQRHARDLKVSLRPKTPEMLAAEAKMLAAHYAKVSREDDDETTPEALASQRQTPGWPN